MANEGRRREKERERERERGDRDGDVPAGEQMVAPFIGLFVGLSHHVSSSLVFFLFVLLVEKSFQARSNPAFVRYRGERGNCFVLILGRRRRSA